MNPRGEGRAEDNAGVSDPLDRRPGISQPQSRVVQIADLSGTFVFAIQGALAALLAKLDPVGVVVLAFLVALGGGIIRDLLIGARPVAAIGDWKYMAIVLIASSTTWLLYPLVNAIPHYHLMILDAAGLALFVVAGTQKSLDYSIHPFVAIFLGTLSGVGGGAMRDVVLNEVPRILWTDIYATAGAAGAAVVVIGHALDFPRRTMAILGGLVCFAIRVAAVTWHWQLPRWS
jgi:uncharacterized membrane protein YeiH